MGKIFDALEKADRQTAASAQIRRLPTQKQGQQPAHADGRDPFAGAIVQQHPGDARMDPNLVAFHNPQSVEAELFKVLRTNLLFPSEDKAPPRSILVTSPVPGDGKSFVSANLAITIAQGMEEHVLLMDCDIRRPSLHTYFGLGRVQGLSDHLAAQVPLEKLLQRTALPKLSILAGGRPPRNPTELLSSKRMRALLDEVAKRYDDRYIIIDSPPPSMATEVTAIAQHVSGVILVIRSGKTPRQAVAETIEQLGKDKILGIVLNEARQSVKKYYGYSKQYYK